MSVTLFQDRRFIQGCQTCAITKTPRHLTSGKLHPLKSLSTSMKTAKLLFSYFKILAYPKILFLTKGLNLSLVCEIIYFLFRCDYELIFWISSTKKKKRKWAKETLSDRKISDNLLSSSTKTPTGLTPFQCIFSFQPPLFPWSTEPSDVQGVDHWLKESEKVWDFARQKEQC